MHQTQSLFSLVPIHVTHGNRGEKKAFPHALFDSPDAHPYANSPAKKMPTLLITFPGSDDVVREFTGDEMSWGAGMKLMKAVSEFKN